MISKKKIKIFKIIIFILAIVMLIALTIYLFPIMNKLLKPDGREAFKAEIEKSGFIGMLLLFGLQASQIFLPILPGEPIEVLAGMCYGSIGGLAFITISVFIITTIIFFTVRKLGRSFVYEIFSEDKVKKLENSKFFKNPKKIEYIMIILFLIPGTPKDILVYLAGLMPIKPFKFILISTIARFPSVISSTIAGDTLASGNWHISILIYLITFAIVGILVFIINKLDKSKVTSHLLSTIKEEKIKSNNKTFNTTRI